MARVNVYLPDELAREWRTAGFNISRVTQIAVERELARWKSDMWLRRVAVQRLSGVSHQEAFGTLTEEATSGGPL